MMLGLEANVENEKEIIDWLEANGYSGGEESPMVVDHIVADTAALRPDREEYQCTDYTLQGDRCWITVVRLSICIVRSSEGVVIDVYPLDHENGAAIASIHIPLRASSKRE